MYAKSYFNTPKKVYIVAEDRLSKDAPSEIVNIYGTHIRTPVVVYKSTFAIWEKDIRSCVPEGRNAKGKIATLGKWIQRKPGKNLLQHCSYRPISE